MEDKKLKILERLLGSLAIEAKTAFTNRFHYFGITELTANQITVTGITNNVPETDGSILVILKADILLHFPSVKVLLLDEKIAPFNYKINAVYSNRVSITLQRLYYDTKSKIIFGM